MKNHQVFFQDYPGIYVYGYADNYFADVGYPTKKLKLIRFYENERQFARCHSERCVRADYGYVLNDNSKKMVVFDHNGNLYSPERLIHIVRKYARNYNFYWRFGKRRWDGWRKPKTTQELKQIVAWESDNEYNVKIRKKRKQLPQIWDDIHRERNRNWKHYRKTQWKDK